MVSLDHTRLGELRGTHPALARLVDHCRELAGAGADSSADAWRGLTAGGLRSDCRAVLEEAAEYPVTAEALAACDAYLLAPAAVTAITTYCGGDSVEAARLQELARRVVAVARLLRALPASLADDATPANVLDAAQRACVLQPVAPMDASRAAPDLWHPPSLTLPRGGRGPTENVTLPRGGRGPTENVTLPRGGRGPTENVALSRGGSGPTENVALSRGGSGLTTNVTLPLSPLGSLVDRARAALQAVAAPESGRQLAQAIVFGLLGHHAVEGRLSNIPILLVAPGAAGGRIARLSLELRPRGAGQFIPHPEMFTAFGPTWRAALGLAWQREYATAVAKNSGLAEYDVVWRLTSEETLVDGPSAQAAFQVALRLLFAGLPYDTSYAISAAVADDGTLTHVDGFVRHDGTPGAKLGLGGGVVVSAPDFGALELALGGKVAPPGGGTSALPVLATPDGQRVCRAATVDEAVAIVSQLAVGIRAYLRDVMAKPNRNPAAYHGGRPLSELYVAPDLLKRVARRVPNRLDEPGGRASRSNRDRPDDADDPDARADRSRLPRDRFAAAALDVTELPYGEHLEAYDERVTLERFRLSPARWAIILAPPGQGKSTLLAMEAAALAELALDDLDQRQVSLDSLRLPIVLSLPALARRSASTPVEADAALRDLIAASAGGPPSPVALYLAAHAHEERITVYADGLDEVNDNARVALLEHLRLLLTWRCRLVFASRPYGYDAVRALFNSLALPPEQFDEYRLAPLNDEQVRTLIDHCFGVDRGSTAAQAPDDARVRADRLGHSWRAARRCGSSPRTPCC